jgi:hypothetical protein
MKLVPTRIAVATQTASTGGRPDGGAATQQSPTAGRARRIVRFAAIELAVWAALYGAYLAIRGLTIGSKSDALAHASGVVEIERSAGIFWEVTLQSWLSSAADFFSAYYMLGFAPLLGVVLVWLALSRSDVYRELRMVLLISIGIATIGFILFPTAPPRLVPELGITDTVGLSGHDTGSFAGIRFNPYAAVPSMHVGWSLLVGFYGLRAASRLPLRAFFFLHPAVMAIAVTATGNHYFFDSLAGITVALVALWVGRRFLRSEDGSCADGSASRRAAPCGPRRLALAGQEA